ncbi:MAG: type II toxin-antitoxin system Phd/YefM family antitoxin [Chloroflexota bacterium]
MSKLTYSIAEARNKFASLIHNVEENKKPVHVTRRGQSVAVILAANEYERLLENQPQRDFWASYTQYQMAWKDDPIDEELDIWADIRDRSTTEAENPWQ